MRIILLALFLTTIAGLVWFLVFSPFSPLLSQKILNPKSQLQELKISEPKTGDVVTFSKIKISGITKAGSFLTIFNLADSKILAIGASGDFETDLTLQEGFNQIKLVNFETDGVLSEKEIEIFYLTSKLENSLKLPNPTTKSSNLDEATQRLLNLRQKQKLNIVTGSVKGILGKNLALETIEGSKTVTLENTQIGEFPNFSNQVTLSQIQAKDFVVALGTFPQQGILSAQILLIAKTKPILAKSAKFGIILQKEKNFTELVNVNNGEKTQIDLSNAEIFAQDNQKIGLENLALGNKVTVVGKLEKDKFTAEKVLVISGDFLGELEKFSPQFSTQSATPSAH